MVDRGPLEAELRNLLLVIQEDFPLVEPREAQEIKTLATQSSQNLRSLAIAIGAHSEALLSPDVAVAPSDQG